MRSMTTVAGGVLAAALLAACSSGEPKNPGTVTVTVPPSPAATPSGSPTGTSGPASASTTMSASVSPTAAPTRLPGTCDSLLADYTVGNALDGLDLGRTAFVVGVPDRAIGRQSTINCRYRITGSGAAAKAGIEIGVSLYRTEAQAAARVTATVDDYEQHGATGTDVAVGTDGTDGTATRLSGGRGDGYDLPLLVIAAGRRTVAVTVDPTSVTKPAAEDAAVTLAELAIERTAG